VWPLVQGGEGQALWHRPPHGHHAHQEQAGGLALQPADRAQAVAVGLLRHLLHTHTHTLQL